MKISQIQAHVRSFVMAQSSRPQASRRALMLWGQPGVGKSSVIRALATSHGWGCTEVRLSELDPTDLTGLPARDGDRAVFLRPALLPEDDGRIHILFLDEVTNSSPAMAGVFSRLALTGQAGTHRLPERCVVIGAGNRASDRSAARDMARHNANRFDHLTVEADAEEVAAYGDAQGWPAMVTGFLRRFPDVLAFDARATEPGWTSPRSLEALADYIRFEDGPELGASRVERIEGIVGKASASQYVALEAIAQDLPLPSEVWADPEGCRVPTNVGARYVVATSLARAVERPQMAAFLQYAQRMGSDMEVMAVRLATAREPKLADCAAYARWAVAAQRAFQ